MARRPYHEGGSFWKEDGVEAMGPIFSLSPPVESPWCRGCCRGCGSDRLLATDRHRGDGSDQDSVEDGAVVQFNLAGRPSRVRSPLRDVALGPRVDGALGREVSVAGASRDGSRDDREGCRDK